MAALELLTHAVDASKRVMHNLRPSILEEGLVAALQWMARNFERRTGVTCVFHTSHEAPALPAGVPPARKPAVRGTIARLPPAPVSSRTGRPSRAPKKRPSRPCPTR